MDAFPTRPMPETLDELLAGIRPDVLAFAWVLSDAMGALNDPGDPPDLELGERIEREMARADLLAHTVTEDPVDMATTGARVCCHFGRAALAYMKRFRLLEPLEERIRDFTEVHHG